MPANPAEGALRSIDSSPSKGSRDVPSGRGGSSRWKRFGQLSAFLIASTTLTALTAACDLGSTDSKTPPVQYSPGTGDALRNVAPGIGQFIK